MAADSRLSEQYMIRSREIQRIFQIDEDIVFAGCGCFSDTSALFSELRLQAQLFSWKSKRRLNYRSAAFLLAHILYTRRLSPYLSFNLIASVDEQGEGRLFRYDCVGSFEEVVALCAGKAEHLIQPMIDEICSKASKVNDSVTWIVDSSESFIEKNLYRIDETVEDSIEVVRKAFRVAAEREITLGDGLNVWVLRKGCGTEKRFYSLPKL